MDDRSELARLSEYVHTPAPRKAPSPLSPEGDAAIMKELANMDWPGSSFAAARAGYYAAMRVMGIEVEPPPPIQRMDAKSIRGKRMLDAMKTADPAYPAGYPKPTGGGEG